MDSSIKIDFDEVSTIIFNTIRDNKSTTMDTLINALKSNYPNVNNIHLRYKLSKTMRKLKDENKVQEIENHRIDFGQNFHQWAQNICLLDLKIIQCLKVLDERLKEM